MAFLMRGSCSASCRRRRERDGPLAAASEGGVGSPAGAASKRTFQPWPVTFFHLGRYFQKPVRMHVVEGGKAREIVYDESYFEMPADSPAKQLPPGAGFAGFRFQESRSGHPGRKGEKLDWRKNDWVAFLGASYFRAIGELYQYGLSARGLAVDPAVGDRPEEFPDFTHVWLETPGEAAEPRRCSPFRPSQKPVCPRQRRTPRPDPATPA